MRGREGVEWHSVQVWAFGHLIMENTLPAERAAWFADAMRQRWKVATVTDKPVRELVHQ